MLKIIFHRFFQKFLANQGPYFMTENKRYSRYQIGTGTYGWPEIMYFDSGATLKIGNYCSIAPGVMILLGGEHHTEYVTTYPFSLLIDEAKHLPGYPYSKGDVNIGNDVWIGQGALILSGIRIENGAVIAGGSVVTRDVLPYSIVAGNPARHIRFRFSQEIIEALQSIAWWNWPASEIKEAWPMLQSDDVQAFIERYIEDDLTQMNSSIRSDLQ